MTALPGGEWERLDELLAARGIKFAPPTLGGTTGGQHAPGSYHYPPRYCARDYGISGTDMPGALDALEPYAQGPGHFLAELFGLTVYWKDGRRLSPSRALRLAHQNHVHAALRPGSGAAFEERWRADLDEEEGMSKPTDALDAITPDGNRAGQWVVDGEGRVHPFHGAPHWGDFPSLPPEDRLGHHPGPWAINYSPARGYDLYDGCPERHRYRFDPR